MEHMAAYSPPQLSLLSQFDEADRAQLHAQMFIVALFERHFGHEDIQMLNILLPIATLHEQTPPPTLVYDKYDSNSHRHQQTQDYYEQQLTHQRPDVDLLYPYRRQHHLSTTLQPLQPQNQALRLPILLQGKEHEGSGEYETTVRHNGPYFTSKLGIVLSQLLKSAIVIPDINVEVAGFGSIKSAEIERKQSINLTGCYYLQKCIVLVGYFYIILDSAIHPMRFLSAASNVPDITVAVAIGQAMRVDWTDIILAQLVCWLVIVAAFSVDLHGEDEQAAQQGIAVQHLLMQLVQTMPQSYYITYKYHISQCNNWHGVPQPSHKCTGSGLPLRPYHFQHCGHITKNAD